MQGINIIELIFQNDLVQSKSEARRILKNNGIKLNDKIISDDVAVAQTFNDFFKNIASSLDIVENRFLITDICNELSDVNKAIAKFENHPSIISIKENVDIESRFSFSEVTVDEIKTEINSLDSKKSGTFMNIPAKQLKQVVEIIAETLMHIWNEEIVNSKKFSKKLNLYLQIKK